MLNKAEHRSPFVYWAQNKESLFLRIEVRDAKNVVLNIIEHNNVDFTAISDGQHYGFCFKLADRVEKEYELKKFDTKIEVVLRKVVPGCFWQHILETTPNTPRPNLPAWLKFDFDRWQDPSEDEQDAEQNMEEEYAKLMNQYKDYEKMNAQSAIMRMKFMYNTYLFVYNLLMFMAHFYVLAYLIYGICFGRQDFMTNFWSDKYWSFMSCTLLQYLDVLHSLAGITKTGWKMALLQVTGRAAVLLIINGNPQLHSQYSVLLLMFNYFTMEQFRYPYYALNLINIEINLLKILRYNMWILLYPIGFTLELLIFVRSIPFYYKNPIYSLQMPNSLNISLNFGIVLAIFTFTLFPYFAIQLLLHMNKQRNNRKTGWGLNLNNKKRY